MEYLSFPPLSKHYGEQAVLESFKLSLPKNKTVCLCGASGCGKTTLLRVISALEQTDDKSPVNSNIKISPVFQEDRLLPWLTAAQNITLVSPNVNPDKYLNDMGLFGVSNKYPDELSGGMRRRVSIARAFAFDGDLFLLDEPFKGLDYKTKSPILKLTAQNLKNKTAVFVTHDLREAAALADEVWLMSGVPLKQAEIIPLPTPPFERDEQTVKNYYLTLAEMTGEL